MKSYYITPLDIGGIYDLSKKNEIVRAENIDNLRKTLIAKYVYTSPPFRTVHAYDGMLRVEDNSTGLYIGTLLFNEKENGRAYWMKRGETGFFYPVSAKTGRISGEGMDYFRSPKKKRRV